MDTATQTAGTNTTDTGTPAAATDAGKDTLLTAQPAAAPAAQTPPAAADTGTPPADGKKADEAPQGAPAEYADFTAPEGMTLNAEAMTELKTFAKEKNLSQEDAQKLADLGAKTVQKVEAGYREKIEQAQTQWAESSRTDKEFGGDNLNANLSVAKKALDTFGSSELSTLLKDSGLGNHPEIIRAFYRVGKAISEDKLVAGTTKPAETDTLKKMYPTMN